MHITLLTKKPLQENLACKKKTPCESSWNFKGRSINFFKWFNPRKFHSFESRSFFALGGERREGREGGEEASVQKWLEITPFCQDSNVPNKRHL